MSMSFIYDGLLWLGLRICMNHLATHCIQSNSLMNYNIYSIVKKNKFKSTIQLFDVSTFDRFVLFVHLRSLNLYWMLYYEESEYKHLKLPNVNIANNWILNFIYIVLGRGKKVKRVLEVCWWENSNPITLTWYWGIDLNIDPFRILSLQKWSQWWWLYTS